MKSRFDARQTVMAGAGDDLAGLARKLAAAPIKPAKPQEPCDIGLFSDEANQLDLVDMFMEPTNGE